MLLWSAESPDLAVWFFLSQLSDYLDGVNVETSSSLSVTVTTKKSSHSWTFSLFCKVGHQTLNHLSMKPVLSQS